MARDPQASLQALARLRRVRMLQAQSRVAQIKGHADAANQDVADTEALVNEYALKNLGTVTTPILSRQHLFAGKVQELVASRRQQADRLNDELERRQALWQQTLLQLRSADKTLELVNQRERVEQERKLRRRSIHRPSATGRWTTSTEPE